MVWCVTLRGPCDHVFRGAKKRQVVIDVQVDDAGALGFFPKHWPPGPVVIGAVLPKKIAALHGVKEGDFLWLVGTQQASLMTPAGLTEALSRRPLSLRFLRGPSAVAQAMASSTARRNDHEERVEVLQQQRDLQMQQLHLQQLQHRKEQQEMTGSDKDWLNLLEKQQDEKLSMQSEQREHLSKLGESLKLHQDLLQELDRDEGSGYSSTVLPALTIPGVRRPPKPAPFARKSGEATEPSERIEQVEVVKAPEAEDVEIEVEIEEAEEPQDQMETAGLAEKEAPVIEQKQEEQLDELEEKKPEEECLPEQLQVEKAPPQELSDQTTQTDPFCQENPLLPSVSAVATEFSGLKPLSALEPRSGQHFEMPKTRQRQLQVTQMEQQQALPGLVEPSQPVETSPGRRLRVVPPPERPPGEGEEAWFTTEFACSSNINAYNCYTFYLFYVFYSLQ